jgi:glutamine amidotransferase
VDGLDGAFVYFVHSFAAVESPDTIATTPFGGVGVCAAVQRGTICGAQFHPEKSGAAGARFLSNFLDLPR